MEIGSLADWAGVVVAFGVGGAAGWLAHRTNQHAQAANDLGEATRDLARSANDIATRANVLVGASNSIAGSLAKLEHRRDSEEADLRASERCMLLIAMSGPIGNAAAAAKTAHDGSGDALKTANVNSAATVIYALLEGSFEVSESVLARIHNLDRATAARIVRSAGLFHMIASRLKTRGMHDLATNFHAIAPVIQVLHADLELVYDECIKAVQESGIVRAD